MLDSLPFELLLYLFFRYTLPLDHLRLRCVCKKFMLVMDERCFWQNLSLESFGQILDDRLMEILVNTKFSAVRTVTGRSIPFIHSLDLTGWYLNSCDGFICIS